MPETVDRPTTGTSALNATPANPAKGGGVPGGGVARKAPPIVDRNAAFLIRAEAKEAILSPTVKQLILDATQREHQHQLQQLPPSGPVKVVARSEFEYIAKTPKEVAAERVVRKQVY